MKTNNFLITKILRILLINSNVMEIYSIKRKKMIEILWEGVNNTLIWIMSKLFGIVSKKTPVLRQHIPILIGDLALLCISSFVKGSKTLHIFSWGCGIISTLLSIAICAWDSFLKSHPIGDSQENNPQISDFSTQYYNISVLSFMICIFGLSFAGLVIAIQESVLLILPILLTLGYIVRESVNVIMNEK